MTHKLVGGLVFFQLQYDHTDKVSFRVENLYLDPEFDPSNLHISVTLCLNGEKTP